jgi:LmbE family N-acetylglucosaminyl deacetylase
MKLDFAGERVLAVVAHPDDAELLCAGTLARARAAFAAIGICTMCRGDKGGSAGSTEQLAERRRREAAAAAKLLGAEAFWVGIGDGELVDTPGSRHELLRIYRRFRPTLVLAHASQDYHADHRAAASIAEAASWFACSPGHHTPEEPLTQPPALWWMDTVGMIGFVPGVYIDISESQDLKRQVLACHQSQRERSGDTEFEPLDQLMMRQMATRGAQAGVAAAEAFQIHHAWKRIRAW